MSFYNSRYRYIIFTVVLFLYILVQTRSSYMAPVVNIIFMIIASRFYKVRGNNIFARWMVVFFCILIIGMLNFNSMENMRQDIACMFPFVLLFANNLHFRNDYLRNGLEGLRKLTPISAVLYCAIFSYMEFSFWGSTETRFFYNEDVHMRLTSPLSPLFYIPLLLCYSKSKYTKLDMVGLIACLLMFLHFSLITSTKSLIIPIVVVVICRMIFSENSKSKYKYIVIVTIIMYFLYSFVQDYFGYFLDLLLGKFDEEDLSNQNRMDETYAYLSQCNILQLLIGKGWGGLKTFHGEEFVGGESMIHIGIAHLMLKGGIILVLLIYYPLISIIIKDASKKKYPYVMIAAWLISKDIGHEIWQTFLMTQIYWLLVYYRFYRRNIHDVYLDSEEKLNLEEERSK